MHSPFCEANKRLRSEQREDPFTSSVFLSSLAKLHASLMQLVVTAVTTAVTGMQSHISIQEWSGLNIPLLQASPTNYSTFQAPNDDIIDNPSARMSVNPSTSSSVEQGSQFQDAHSQMKTLASCNINLSRIKLINEIFHFGAKVILKWVF